MLRRLEIAATTFSENECWYFPAQINRLYSKNILTGELSDCGSVPWETEYASLLYRSMEYIDGKVYLMPYSARSIAVYDTKKKTFSQIELEEKRIQGKRFLFQACFSYDHKVFVFGIHVHTIIKINTEDDSIAYIDEWVDSAEKMLSAPHGILSRSQIVYTENRVLLPLFYGDVLLSFDCSEEKAKVIKLKTGSVGFSGACCNSDGLWLVDRGGRIVCTDYKKTSIKRVFEIEKESINIDVYILDRNNSLNLFSTDSDRVHLIEQNIGLIGGKYECICSNTLYTAFWSYDTGQVIVYKNGSETYLDMPIDVDDSVFRQIYYNAGYINESLGFGLKEFLADIGKR